MPLLPRCRVLHATSSVQILRQRGLQIRPEMCTPPHHPGWHRGQPGATIWCRPGFRTTSTPSPDIRTTASPRPALHASTRFGFAENPRLSTGARRLPTPPTNSNRLSPDRLCLHFRITPVRITVARELLRTLASCQRIVSARCSPPKLLRQQRHLPRRSQWPVCSLSPFSIRVGIAAGIVASQVTAWKHCAPRSAQFGFWRPRDGWGARWLLASEWIR